MNSCCLIVLNYNGIDHLEDCLGSLLAASRQMPPPCPVVCVDNRSTDGSAEFVRGRFPEVELWTAPRNDFLFSLNGFLRQRREEVAVVVNNDMKFDPGFLSALLGHFADPRVFAVGAAIYNWEGSRMIVGQRRGEIRNLWFYKDWDFGQREVCPSLEASGGACALRRGMFLELGGFDPLYRPGYYEDLDLSFRAWERGWKVFHEPRSVAFHRESASMLKRYGAAKKARILYRNHLLFTAKNVGGWGFLGLFLALLPLRAIRPLLRGYRVPFQGFLAALPLLPRAVAQRWRRPCRRHDPLPFLPEGAEGRPS